MKLILHLGAGKTGTSSIQRTLRENDTLLKKNGVWYLGLMLERSGNKLFDWQRESTVIHDFYKLSHDVAEAQLLEVLRLTIEEGKKSNIQTLIWSNESLLMMKRSIASAFQVLQEEGIEIELLYYVRDYTSWAHSAYLQWGIKDKMYEGKLKTFREFRKIRFPHFYKDIEYFIKVMPEAIKVRNMSATENVVLDFLNFAQIKIDNLEIFRINDTPKNEELLLRATFNSRYDGRVLPKQFDNIIGKNISFSKTPKQFLEELLPIGQDMENVLDDSLGDRELMNELLLQQSQPVLDSNIPVSKSPDINNDKLLMALTEIVVRQSQKIAGLQKTVNEIQKRLKDET